MKKITLLRTIPITPPSGMITIVCEEKLEKDDRVEIPSIYVKPLKTTFVHPSEKKISYKGRKYKVKQVIGGKYYLAEAEVIAGNKATQITREVPVGVKLKVYR